MTTRPRREAVAENHRESVQLAGWKKPVGPASTPRERLAVSRQRGTTMNEQERIGELRDALEFCVETLRRIQWSGYDDTGDSDRCPDDRCPECGGRRESQAKHSQECHLEAALEIATEALGAT